MASDPDLDHLTIGRLTERMGHAEYTVDGVAERLGEVAQAALGRNETTPARRATRTGDGLDTLIRLWPLGLPVPVDRVDRALPGLLAPLCEGGVLRRDGSDVRALVGLSPYANDEHGGWWLASDVAPDLIVSNPPFVVSPGTVPAMDSGRLVDRVARWTGACDAWVVQREVADPARYVELWLRDAGVESGPDYVRRYDAWLDWFEQQRITGVGMGWVVLRRAGRQTPVVRFEDWPYEVERPLGPEVAAWTERCDRLAAATDDDLLGTAWRRRPDVRQETLGEPGAEDPEAIVLRQQRGLRRARRPDRARRRRAGRPTGAGVGHRPSAA